MLYIEPYYKEKAMLLFIIILFALFILITIAQAVYETSPSARQNDIDRENRLMEIYNSSK